MALFLLGFVLLHFTYVANYELLEDFEKLMFPNEFANTIRNTLLNNETDISLECYSEVALYAEAILNQESWALLMFDSSSKLPPAGIFSGNLDELGSFDQCLGVEKTFKITEIIIGKYCVGSISFKEFSDAHPTGSKILKSVYRDLFQERNISSPSSYDDYLASFAICFPDACSSDEIQKLYSEIELADMKFSEILCQTKLTQPELDMGDIAVLSFLAIIVGLMIFSTIYDVVIFYLKKDSAHYTLTSFSLLTNGRKLIDTSKNPTQIHCLYGIRVLSIMWIILGHRYIMDLRLPKMNTIDTISWSNDAGNMFIMSANLAVDTFFLLGGVMVAYGFMNTIREGFKFNIILYYFHRYLRLAPLLAVAILLQVTVFKHLGSGPYWIQETKELAAACQKYWWTTLLFVQNYTNLENLCIGQTWYLCVDMQLFLISPIFLIPLRKWPKIGLLIVGFLTICSIGAGLFVAFTYKFKRFGVANDEEEMVNILVYYYFLTHTRAAPWFIGVVFGYYIYEIKEKNRNMNKLAVLVVFMVALGIILTSVFAGFKTRDEESNIIIESLYAILLRPIWAIAIGWIILVCAIGCGGPVNWFLSLSMFQVTSKLTYSMFLFHSAIITFISARTRTQFVFDNLHEFYTFWADFAFTVGVSLVLSLAFEFPFAAIENSIFRKREVRKEPAKNIEDG